MFVKIVCIPSLFVAVLASCFSLNEKIEITSEYIINENWDKRGEEIGGNSIEIKKMKVKPDSTLNPFSDLSQMEILSKLKEDSSFIYVANIKIKPGESYKNKKIYFNRDNGFYWWTDKGNSKTNILGKLQAGSWYEISRLTYYYYVIYVDSADEVHPFIVNLANY